MKLKELKKMLSKMSENELDKDIIIISNDMCSSGISTGKKAKCKLLYDGGDDPSELKSLAELKGMYDPEEIAGMEVVVERGDFYIEF